MAASAISLVQIGELTGLPREALTGFYDLFAKTEKVVTIFSQGVNQSSSGTDKVNAIINCHLATGRIGKPGAGPFSITGQPNAMGGREVGGLANMLAAHMEIENPADRDLVRRFWRAQRMAEKPGLKAVDLFRAVADGRIKALWIMATNPVDSMPDANLVESALKICPFVVVSDVLAETDTMRHAHIALPAAAWGEKDGTVTNSERRISRQRPFLAPPGEARSDWRIICDVAARMGFANAFLFDSPAAVFAEHAALSGFENDGSRAFDIGAFADMGQDDYDRMEPVLWPCPKGVPASRVFGRGRYFSPERKARLLALSPPHEIRTSDEFPLILNTGRVRDHWHTLTRTGKSARLSQHLAEPFAEIHPEDAAHYGIKDASVTRVSRAEESILVRALLTARQKRGTIFVPMHWTDQFASRARVDTLVPGVTDPYSGQPALKHVPVSVAPFAARAYGFAVLRERPAYLDAEYWAIAKCEAGWRVELAFSEKKLDWSAFAAALFGYEQGDTLSYHDEMARLTRFACFSEQSLVGALFLGPEPVAVSRNWAVEQLKATFADRRSRLALIAGRPGRGVVDPGATVCSCFGVGANQIAQAVRGGSSTVEAIGQTLQAGTNCGSCRAEIKILIDAHRARAAE
jgi:assimilatory nitrate reductase catalytic subunit